MSIKSIRERVEEATPGPWEYGTWSGHCLIEAHGKNHPGPPRCKYTPIKSDYGGHHLIRSSATDAQVTGNYDYEEGGVIGEPDAAFIAHARTDIPALLAVAEAAAAVVADAKEMRAILDELATLLGRPDLAQRDAKPDAPLRLLQAAIADLEALP